MKTSKTNTIFFSWQSDLPASTNRSVITNSIKQAIKGTDLSYDEATERTSGSINILNAIFDKILAADIFVCDITTVGQIHKANNRSNSENRSTSNPNVLLELGYAIANLGWERIILVYNEKFANKKFPNFSDLPFDIPKHSITPYKVDKNGKTKLTDTLKAAIEAILNNAPVKNADIIRSVREGKRVKDVENLCWIFKRINLKAFDTFRDNLPENLYMPVVEFFTTDIMYVYSNSLFHIHNQELSVLIDDFCGSLGTICNIGERLHYPDQVRRHKDYIEGTGFYFMHGLENIFASDNGAWHQFNEGCSKFNFAYQRLIPYIRDFYSLTEIDVDKLSVEANNAFVDFLNERNAIANQFNSTKQRKSGSKSGKTRQTKKKVSKTPHKYRFEVEILKTLRSFEVSQSSNNTKEHLINGAIPLLQNSCTNLTRRD